MGKKISLVLEGGGMRGAYTAGCLSWLIDEGIEFDGAYGISTGALYLITFLSGNKTWLKEFSCRVLPAKENVGVSAFLKEGQIVAYNQMFSRMVEDFGFDLKKIKTNTSAKIGLYDLDLGKTIYIPFEKVNQKLIIAACSLPLIGKVCENEGSHYLDGGISKMIPVEEAISDGYDKFLIITTKPSGFTRKPAKKIVVDLMRFVYKKCPNISKDYEVRHINYSKQIDIINDLVKQNKAVYRYPTKTMNVSRLGGSFQDLETLFEMGYSDMESIKEDIYKLVKE